MIYVITHKVFEDEKLNKELYKVLHVGKNKDSKDDYIRDDTGDNISEKNPEYCELTGLYWIWKNAAEEPDDITGIVHYRRFFTDKKGYADWKKRRKMPEILDNENGKLNLEDDQVILPSKYTTLSTLRNSYKRCHDIRDLEYVRQAVKRLYPGYVESFDKVLSGHKGYYFNMFICKRKVLERYCEWLFPLLFYTESIKKTEEAASSGEINVLCGQVNGYQTRVYGFLAERLLQVWINHEGLNIVEKPVFNTDEPPVGFIERNFIRVKYLWFKHVLHRKSKYINK